MQKRKDTLIIISAILAAVLVLFIGWQAFLGRPNVLQTSVSPDGKYTAYVYEQNYGATTSFCYHLSILRTGLPLLAGNANTYQAKDPFTIQWLTSNELFVNNTPGIIYKQKCNIRDVIILYGYYDES